jgi:hypothetical protein
MSEINIRAGILAIVGIVVVLVMFAALLPMVTETIDNTESTGTVAMLLNNLPLFLVLGIVLAVIAASIGYLALRGGD